MIKENNSSISFTKPKETTKISRYWSEFSQVYVAHIKQDLIICDRCKTVLIYKPATGSGCMLSHSRSCQSKHKPDATTEKQTIQQFFKSSDTSNKKVPKRIKDGITASFAEFVVTDGRAFHLVQGKGFINLAKQLYHTGKLMSSSMNIEVDDLLPDPTTISRYIDRMYSRRIEQLIQICQFMDSYCVIVDFWSESYTGLSYCGVAISHIDREYQSNIFVLGCFPYDMENKRAVTIRSYVEDILDGFGLKLHENIFVMTDNEPTMKCTFNNGCIRIGCSDHYINKQLQHAFTSETIDGEFVNCKEAQRTFYDIKSIVASVRRMHKQQTLSKRLILYSETRFSGAYGMLSVFLDVFDELGAILDSKLLTTYSQIDKELLKDICELLTPFDTIIDTLSDSKRPTLHRVLPFKQFLINQCDINDDDKEGLKQLKSFLRKRINQKWELSDEHLIATLIHPNLKHFQVCPDLKDRAVFLLKQKMVKRQGNTSTNSETMATSTSPIISSTSTSITSSTFSRKNLLLAIYDKQPVVPEKTGIEQELEKYLSSTSLVSSENDDDVLSYWKEHQSSFPSIAAVARDILAIPASNTCVERLFSSCKNTITEKRTRLGAKKLNKIMFLQKNMNILKEKFDTIHNEINDLDHQCAKRKQNAFSFNDLPISKRAKAQDILFGDENVNEYLDFIHSDDDDREEDI